MSASTTSWCIYSSHRDIVSPSLVYSVHRGLVMTDFNDPGRRPAIGTRPPVVSFDSHPGQGPLQPHQLSSASSYADLQYLFGIQDPTMLAPKSNRNRRKSGQGSEHTKHRRTRSGCYTCRSRRVKVLLQSNNLSNSSLQFQCDESHPVCERMDSAAKSHKL